MKKILIAALATSFALGFSESYASEEVIAPEADLAIEEPISPTEAPVEGVATPSQYDSDIVIYEVESSAPDKGADYVIIKNNGSETINLDGWYIFDNKDYDQFTKLSGIKLAPGQSYKLVEDVDFNFGLGKNDQVRLFNAQGELIKMESWQGHAQEVLRLNPETGLLEDTAQTEVEPPVEETPAEPPLIEKSSDFNIVINEVESDDEVEPDYIELYNKGSKPVNIKDWYVFDEKDRDIKALGDITINPGEFVVLENGSHFDFGLGNGDSVRLFNSQGSLIDQMAYDSHAHGVWSRYPDGTGDFIDAEPSKNEKNSDKSAERPIEEADDTSIVINEVFQKSSGNDPDYVELKNTSDKDISLTGWYILDDDLTRSPQPVGEGVVIPAGGYYVLTNGKDFSFGLGKNDQVNLFNPEGKLADNFAWQGHVLDQAYSRDEKTGKFTVENPTPGRSNDSKTEEELSKQTPVVVNEVESSPTGGGKDYTEIYNRSNKDIDISGWYILDNKATEEKTTKVKEGTILKSGEYYVFEQGVDFDFGLGSNDEVNLFDKDGNLVDQYGWTSHASGTYGRYPDGFGEFVDGKASKGRANVLADDETADIERGNWPGSQEVKVIDESPIFDLKDLSGLDNHDGWIYGVNNKEGRFVIFKIENDQVVFAPGFDEKGKAVNFLYDADDLTKLGPDSEGITVDGKGRVYLAIERDNNNKNVNYNAILQVADPFKDEKVLVADRQWDITNLLPDVGANLGIETVEWVSMENLNGLLYDQKNNKVLDANDYKDAYADGIFFVGVEANGHVYALVLKDEGKAELIADIPTGLGGVMSLDFDKENNVLWAGTDDEYNNIHTIIQFNGTNSPTKIHLDPPSKMDKKLNNEGFVIDSKVDENGNRPTYWFMDGTNEKAFRKSSIKADYMDELGLDKIEGKKIKDQVKPSTPPADDNNDNQAKPIPVPRPEKKEKPSKEIIVDSKTKLLRNKNKVYVKDGYSYFEEGYYQVADLLEIRSDLLKALENNRIMAKAAKYLLEHTPKTVEKIKPILEDLIKQAEDLQKMAEEAIVEIDTILE